MRKPLSLSVATLLLVAGCAEPPTPPDASTDSRSADVSAAVQAPVVNVTAVSEHDHDSEDDHAGHHEFRIDRTEMPAGWTTFRFENAADVTHFVAVQRLPEEAGDITLDEYVNVVTQPFQRFLELFLAGDDNPSSAFADTPGWFFDPGVTFLGGPGLTGPGRTSSTTVDLEPGRYVVECYVRGENDVFHSANGMIEMMTVTEESNGAPRPEPDIEVTISQSDGIELTSIPRPHPARHRSILPRRDYTIAVHYEDQATYEHLLGHDVHLVRINSGADRSELNAWMNWLSEDGLKSPKPQSVDFLGGVQDVPGGQTAYFTAEFRQGKYALVAEVPDPRSKGMFRGLTVPLWWFGGG